MFIWSMILLYIVSLAGPAPKGDGPIGGKLANVEIIDCSYYTDDPC